MNDNDRNTFTEQLQNSPTQQILQQILLPNGTPYIEVRMMNAESREAAEVFIEIFRRLISYYINPPPDQTDAASQRVLSRDEMNAFYQVMIPDLRAIVPEATPAPTEAIGPVPPPGTIPVGIAGCKKGPGAPAITTGISRINALTAYAPDVIAKNYSRDGCQCARQPDPIAVEDIPAWKAQTFTKGGQVYNKQVLDFPPNDPRYHFICTSEKYPFPGVKENTKLVNKDVYPFIPCCYTEDQMDLAKKNKAYVQYVTGTKRVVSAATKSKVIQGDKILTTHRPGAIITTKIADLLKNYSPTAVKMVRFGMPQTSNSLIHCVLTAVHVEDYIRLTSDEAREEYAQRIRVSLAIERYADAAQKVPVFRDTSVYRQELYDYDNESIRQQLLNMTLFLDPALYYRGLEEMFNVNIYTFTPTYNKDDPAAGYLELPRAKSFHVRPPRSERQSVIIFKQKSTPGENLLYPHCELVIDYNENTREMVKLFGADMTTFLHDTLLKTHEVLTANVTENVEENGAINAEVIVRKNLYLVVNFFEVLENKAKSQIIDEYGKVIAFIFETADGLATLCVQPSQPEQLPIHIGPLPRIPAATAISLFGQPSSVTRRKEGLPTEQRVDGMWFPVFRIPDGVYVPLQAGDGYQDLPVGPRSPIADRTENPITRLTRLKRTLNIMIQLVQWLFVVAQKKGPASVADFATRYFTVLPPPDPNLPEEDSAEYYDLSGTPRLLPEVDTVEDALAFLTRFIPDFVRPVDAATTEPRLVFATQALYEKMVKKLDEYYILHAPLPVRTALEKKWESPTEITGLYTTANDFAPQPSVNIFIGERDISNWLDALDPFLYPAQQSIIVEKTLDSEYGSRLEPYLYSAPDGKLYIIQNVDEGALERAMQVCLFWAQAKINQGRSAKPYFARAPVPHVVYAIGGNGIPRIFSDQSNGSLNYIQLLSYGAAGEMKRDMDGKFVFQEGEERKRFYAAMLPLL